MEEKSPSIKYRKDYIPAPYMITDVFLDIRLNKSSTTVHSKLQVCKAPGASPSVDSMSLDGENLILKSIKLNNVSLRSDAYTLTSKCMVINNLPEQFELLIETEIDPDNNTALEGLYRSSGNYCTQCEAEGFRKITYYLDRPDNMARFTTRIEGDPLTCPVMLSNGNLKTKGTTENGNHFMVWEDPFPKPSYLFALVAGNLVCIKDTYTTGSGRELKLEIYVEERNKLKCGHAMESLKKSMEWDEEVFGLEYDLDTYMIVAVDDFNMGAMENKGLNIFNSKYVLALEETATDLDFLGIEGVIAHEYFHNWTGNRVTCRDWFQLSLKEGLTVFRDQEFSSDMNSRAVQRIDDVKILRDYQFKEDAGPMAHSVRPDSYVEINNFYTVTVYNKGAEVIRMIHTLLGSENFRKGMDLYFSRHDGQAVTCDDFVSSMAKASQIDLNQFSLWYSQAGTPIINIETLYDKDTESFHLIISQECNSTPGQQKKKPFHIPLRLSLLGQKGPFLIPSSNGLQTETTVELKQQTETYIFKNISNRPVVSINRGFSAPVKISPFQSDEDLAFLMANDSDLFNRWEASSNLATSQILKLIKQLDKGQTPKDISALLIDGIKANLCQQDTDKSLIAQAITLPSEMYLAQHLNVINPDTLFKARKLALQQISKTLTGHFLTVYQENSVQGEYRVDNESIGKRRLKNTCLAYLMSGETVSKDVLNLCLSQYQTSVNMTDKIAAVKELANLNIQEREDVLIDFAEKWKNDPLVMDKWFVIQATSTREQCLDDVLELMNHPSFSLDNPNKVRALIGGFASGNHIRFHHISGEGYSFLADQVINLNKKNPQIAARLLTPLISWEKYDATRKSLMRDQLKRISLSRGLSPDVYEIIKKSM